jgi:hypothetical protein
MPGCECTKEQLRTPLAFSRYAIKSRHHGFGKPILFVLDPASPLDLIDYWNIRLYEPNVLPVNVNWISETRDFLHEFIKSNYRPLPGNQHGVMIRTTVQFGRSISKERAEAIVADERFGELPQGSWLLKLWYDRIWAERDDDMVFRPKRMHLTAGSVLTLKVFKDRLGLGRATLTHSTGVDLEFDADTKREIDFAFWYQKEQLVEREDRLQLVFGETKSFGREAFDERDVDTMKRLAASFPGSFFVFSTLKDELSDAEKTAIAPFAIWGRERGVDGRPRAPVIVLTGLELFASWHVEQCWKDLGGRHAAFVAHPATQLSTLQNLADFTQQLYLGLPDPYAELRARLGTPRAAAHLDAEDEAPSEGELGGTAG